MRIDPLPDHPHRRRLALWNALLGPAPRLAHVHESRSTSLAFALYQGPDGWLLRTPLPGVQAGTLQLEVEESTLTLAGEWPREEVPGALAQHLERPRGTFRRSLRVPFEIDTSRVRARLEHGLLEVHLPRLARRPPVRVPVQEGSSETAPARPNPPAPETSA